MANLLHLFKNVKSTVCAILLAMIVPGLQSCLDEFVNSNQEYDTEVPSIHILNPTSDDVFVTTEGDVVISGTASDNQSLKSVNYNSNTGSSGTATGLENWSITDLVLAQGDNTIQVNAVDESGNKSTTSITITRNKYLTFLGTPTVDNDVLYTNNPTELWITVSIAPNDRLIPSSVKIIEIDGNNQVLGDVCSMYDDGNLDHGDEIKGDNVFSVKHTFNYDSEGTKRFRVSALTSEDEGEVEGLSAVFILTVVDQQNATQHVQNLLDIHRQIEQKLAEMSSMSVEEKASVLMKWLATVPTVKNAVNEDGCITITHISGMESEVLLTPINSDIKGGGNVTDRRNTPSIPLSRQTRGINDKPAPHRAPYQASTNTVSNDITQNKNVLIWAPFENQFAIDMQPSLDEIFKNSIVGLHVKYLSNSECTRASLLDLNKYGIIVIDSHGKGGNLIYTREKVSNITELVFQDINNLFNSNYRIVTMDDWKTYYAVTAKFIKNQVNGTLPNSIVFNGSCESMKTDRLANAFISKGAKTYLGFKARVLTSTCKNKADEFFSAMVGNDLKTTGQAYIADLDFMETEDDKSWYNSYLMDGSKSMRFYMGLINGDFEYGNLNGWDINGDGRVITKLGSLKPTQGYYMGIVSTGLGYTEAYGRISQSFKVTSENTLSIKWNFLSEEFMEYVGSIYQDYLKISITDGHQTKVLFSKAIDELADQYPPTQVSPTIVFDRGDVYMTGWQTSTFDISQFHGKTATIIIETGDIGDSYYDSATLLDEITIY